MATDAAGVFLDFGKPEQRAIVHAHPDWLLAAVSEFAPGSMLPKVLAACSFASATNRPAVIGSLSDIAAMIEGTAGTRVSTDARGVEVAGRTST